MGAEAGLRIALVEDDPNVRDGIGRALAMQEGWHLVATAGSLSEAQALPWAQIDLVLLDIGLPDGDGLELLSKLPEHCQVLVISALGDELTVVRALEQGAAGYLLKEAHASQLLSAIQAVLDGGAPISPGVAHHLLRRMRKGLDGATQTRSTRAGLEELTPRESEVLRVLARGYSYEEAARLLGISRHTVGQHVKQVYAKLAVNSRSQAVFEAIRAGWLESDAG